MTVGILAAVYFFVVKPTLDTTKTISHEVNGNIQQSLREAHIGKTIQDVDRQVQREIKRSIRNAPSHTTADKLLNCIQRAHQNVHKIEHCNEKY